MKLIIEKLNLKKLIADIPMSTILKYACFLAVSLLYWEIIMALKMGSLSFGTLFLLFFIPGQCMFFTAFCGIGNEISSKIIFPLVVIIPAIYYAVQSVYLTNFGSLFSISMIGMGTDAVGDFGWAVKDSLIKDIPVILLILLPFIISLVISIVSAIKEGLKVSPLSYGLIYHLAVLILAVIMFLAGVGIIRLFGNDRGKPYYLLTSKMATTDQSAKKLGVLTTALAESVSYYSASEDSQDVFVKEETITNTANEMNTSESIKVIPLGMTEEEYDEGVEEEESVVYLPWINEELDFNKVYENAPDEATKNLASYFVNREPSLRNEYTGMFEGYNLIYICAESFWNYACNETITPTLYEMANGGIVLNNYYNSFFNTTTNGEYAFCTSLWPDVSRNSRNGTDVGSFAQSASKYMPQGLGDLFTMQDIPSYAYHNYYGKYYRRILSWPNLGYKCRFTGDNMYFSSNWPSSDLELMEQTVDDYIDDDQFHAYYMTFSGHGPFTSKNYMFNKNIKAVTDVLGEDKYNLEARGYFAGELELDRAMEYLLKRLKEAGKLDKTVIVIAADHYPYYLSDEGRVSVAGYDIDQNFDIYRSNCIIYNAGMEPMSFDGYCSNVDIAPTMLNLFNIPFDSRLMMGRDIFSDKAHNRGTLYNMSFVTDKVEYNYEKGEAMWKAAANDMSEADKESYINANIAQIENEYNASCKIIENNFFLKAYKACNLLTDEEINEELKREEKVKAQDEDLNAMDEEEKLQRELEQQQQEALEQMLLLQNQGLEMPPAVPQ